MNLKARLDRLIANAPVTRPTFVWRELGETGKHALAREFGAAAHPPNVRVIGWAENAVDGTPDPSSASGGAT